MGRDADSIVCQSRRDRATAPARKTAKQHPRTMRLQRRKAKLASLVSLW
jgi:hypothetical protein